MGCKQLLKMISIIALFGWIIYVPTSLAAENNDESGAKSEITDTDITYSEIGSNEQKLKELGFDVDKATKALNEKTIKLSIQNVVADDLEKAAEEIAEMREKAKACVTLNVSVIKKIDAVLPEIDPNKEVTLTPNEQYLIKKKINATNLVSECRFFVLIAEEAITAFNATAQTIKKKIMFLQCMMM